MWWSREQEPTPTLERQERLQAEQWRERNLANHRAGLEANVKDGEKKTDYDNELSRQADTNESVGTQLYDRAENGGYQRSEFQEFEFQENFL